MSIHLKSECSKLSLALYHAHYMTVCTMHATCATYTTSATCTMCVMYTAHDMYATRATHVRVACTLHISYILHILYVLCTVYVRKLVSVAMGIVSVAMASMVLTVSIVSDNKHQCVTC